MTSKRIIVENENVQLLMTEALGACRSGGIMLTVNACTIASGPNYCKWSQLSQENVKKLDAWVRNGIFAWTSDPTHTWDDRRGKKTLWDLCNIITNYQPNKYNKHEPMQMFRCISKS